MKFLPAVLMLLGLSLAQAPASLAEQLKAGETTYFLACAICHGDRLEGVSAPALMGKGFVSAYDGVVLDALTGFIAEQMPHDHPGSLSEQEVLDVAAFLLAQNGAKLPETGLSKAELNKPLHFAP